MRWMVALSLAGLLALGGCPSGTVDIPSAVTILTAGTYNGTLACTATVTGQTPQNTDGPAVVQITEQGQLFINEVAYFEGATGQETDAQSGVVNTLTINSITEDEATGTVEVAGTGTATNSQTTYNTTRQIVLVQVSDTEIELTDIYAGQATDRSFELNCTGTVTR